MLTWCKQKLKQMKNWLFEIAEWYKPRDPMKWIMTWIIFQNEKCDDIKTTIIIEDVMGRIVIMLAKSNMRSLTYPVSQLLDIS